MWDFSLGNYCMADLADVQFSTTMFEKPLFTISATGNVALSNGERSNAISFTCPGCGAPPNGREHNCKYCGRKI